MAPIHFGSLCFDYQATDVFGPFDLLNSCNKGLLTAINEHFTPISPEALARAPEFVFHHIGVTLDPVTLATRNLAILPSTTVDDCPELDALLVGGPNPLGFDLHPKYAEFIRRHVAAGKLLLTNCTGAFVVAASGVLDGKNATTNNVEYHWVKKKYPKVKWTKEKKWIVDGNLWTASGAVAGMDMFSFWLKEKFGLELLTEGAKGLDYEPRDQDGLFNVLPQRYDGEGNKISTHVFA